MVNGKRLNIFSKIRNEARRSALIPYIQLVVPASTIRQGKEIKGKHTGKSKVNVIIHRQP